MGCKKDFMGKPMINLPCEDGTSSVDMVIEWDLRQIAKEDLPVKNGETPIYDRKKWIYHSTMMDIISATQWLLNVGLI